jgi:hypothetical protein
MRVLKEEEKDLPPFSLLLFLLETFYFFLAMLAVGFGLWFVIAMPVIVFYDHASSIEEAEADCHGGQFGRDGGGGCYCR